ncbi:MAG TPA: hypothetical protein VMF31_12750 [Solirubrobacterales bacterium]|nr:hypothetical protein [Solirubrobacterales bacterium]
MLIRRFATNALRTFSRLCLPAIILGLAAFAAPAQAGTPGPWVVPGQVAVAPNDQANMVKAPGVAVGPDGSFDLSWYKSNGYNSWMQSMRLGSDAQFSEPGSLSSETGFALTPDMAPDSSGASTIVWMNSVDLHWVIQAASRLPDGTFGQPVNLSALSEQSFNPRVDSGADGSVGVAWERPNGVNRVIEVSTRAGYGQYSDPVLLSDPNQKAWDPEVAVADDGTVAAVWSFFDGSDRLIAASVKPPNGVFSAPKVISKPGVSAYVPEVAFEKDGSIVVIWSQESGSKWTVRTTTRKPNQQFSVPLALAPEIDGTFDLSLVSDATGTTTAAWSQRKGGISRIQVASRKNGGSFGAAVPISEGGQNAESAVLASGIDGSTVALWRRFDGSHWIVQASTRPPAGDFSQPADLSDPALDSSEPGVAIGPDGVALAAWTSTNGDTSSLVYTTSKRPTAAVSVTTEGPGAVSSEPAGIDCGALCEAEINLNAKVKLTATAAEDGKFVSWGGACAPAGSEPLCTLTIKEAAGVKATFEKKTDENGGGDGGDGGTNPTIQKPTTTIAGFDGKNLHIRLACPKRFQPACRSVAMPVTKRSVKGRPMAAKAAKVKIRAGRWKNVKVLVKPAFRKTVEGMVSNAKRLHVKQTIRSKRIRTRRSRGAKTIFHTYKVRTLESAT